MDRITDNRTIKAFIERLTQSAVDETLVRSSPLTSPKLLAQKIRMQVTEQLQTLLVNFQVGIEALHQEAEHRALHDQNAKPTVAHLESVLNEIGSSSKWDDFTDESTQLYQQIGISDAEIIVLYSLAKGLLEGKHFHNAAGAFTVLVTLCPYVDDCWAGLGAAAQGQNDLQSAVFAYSEAIALNAANSFARQHLADCYLQLGRKLEAQEIIGHG